MRRLALTMLTGCALLPAPAFAAWTPTSDLSPRATDTSAPLVVAGADGSALIGFERGGRVFTILKPAGANFGAVRDHGAGSRLSIAMAPTGRAIAAWAGAGTAKGLHLAVREPGGSLVSSAKFVASADVTSISTAIATDGQAFIGATTALGATLTSNGPGELTRTSRATLTAAGAYDVAVTATPTGDKAWMAVARSASSTTSVQLVPWRAVDGAQAPVSLESFSEQPSANSSAGLSQLVATGGSDHPSFFWSSRFSQSIPDPFGGSTTSTSNALVRTDEAEPNPTRVDSVSDSGFSFGFASLSEVSSTEVAGGGAVATWLASDPVATRIMTSRRTPGDSRFSAPILLTGPLAPPAGLTNPGGVAIAPTTNGGVAIIASRTNQLIAGRLDATSTPVGGTEIIPMSPADNAYGPAAAGTGSGELITAFMAFAAGDAKVAVQASTFDEVPPALTVAPESSTPSRAGGPITLSATAADRWSPVSPVSWDFGDGTTGAGDSITRTFPVGTTTVTASVTDAAGNRTTATTPVTVLAPTPSPAPEPTPVVTPHLDPCPRRRCKSRNRVGAKTQRAHLRQALL